ncbi:MAG TPA: hypothetical protein DCS43_11530 [Verrucomicrobia bacterium]|nr:hypothetical protein [Verrucomicrobiota bacterium]
MLDILKSIEWLHLLGTTPWEILATVSGMTGVILIARQNILGWPLGLVWAAISACLAFRWNLVSDSILYLSAIPMQVYCWIVWYHKGKESMISDIPFRPTWMPVQRQLLLVVAAMLSIFLWGKGITAAAGHFSWVPEPSLLWRDSTTTVLNYYAQFLQARKRMENWLIWVIVNILGIHIYWVKDAPIYSIQYAFFLVLGVYGWVQWHRKAMHKQVAP